MNNRQELIDDLQQKTKTLDAKYILSKCFEKSIPIGKVNDIEEGDEYHTCAKNDS